MVAASWYGKMDRGWDLSSDAVIGECADQADGRVRRACRYYGEVGVVGFAGFGQTIETAAEFDDSAAITQGIERVGVHPGCDQIASAKRAALLVEGLECEMYPTSQTFRLSSR